MDIMKLKTFLVDKHEVLVLDDMWGPTSLNAGMAFVSASTIVDIDITEEELSDKIAEHLNSTPMSMKAIIGDKEYLCFSYYTHEIVDISKNKDVSWEKLLFRYGAFVL